MYPRFGKLRWSYTILEGDPQNKGVKDFKHRLRKLEVQLTTICQRGWITRESLLSLLRNWLRLRHLVLRGALLLLVLRRRGQSRTSRTGRICHNAPKQCSLTIANIRGLRVWRSSMRETT